MKILGIKVNEVNKSQASEKVTEFLNSDKQYKIFTPNPEMLVDASADKYFMEVLNSGDLNICDGFGLELISRFLPLNKGETKRGWNHLYRIPGVDFMIEICRIAEEKGSSIYLLGSSNRSILENTAKNLKQQFSKLNIAGYGGESYKLQVTKPALSDSRMGYKLQYKKEKNQEILDNIIDSSALILFVAFGHNKQEKWIYENLSKLPNIKIAMGVGGSFDYISNQTKRAPKCIQKIGLEWLYRLIKQPTRVKRIYKATIKFMYLMIKKSNLC